MLMPPVPAGDFLMLCCSAPPARAETWVAIDNANPPFMYQQDNQPMGLYPLIVQAVFARLGEPLNIQAMRRGSVRYCEAPPARWGLRASTRMPSACRSSITRNRSSKSACCSACTARSPCSQGIADLHGKRIGAIRGWSYTEEFDQAARTGRSTPRRAGRRSQPAQAGLLLPGRGDCHRAGRAAPAHTCRPGAAGATAASY